MLSCCRVHTQADQPAQDKVKEEPPAEAKVGDLVELFMGRGQVREIREQDGMLEVWALGWEMAGEQRPRFFVQRSAVKVVPTVYYKMPGTYAWPWPRWPWPWRSWPSIRACDIVD